MRKVILVVTVLIGFSSGSNSQWVQQNSGTAFLGFYDVKMLSVNTVYAAAYYPDGYGWVFRTTNAGINWGFVYQTQNPLNQIAAVSFSSVNTGIAVGGGLFNGSFMIKTTNGGANWTTLNSGTNFYHNDIKMINSNTGYVCGQLGSILRTDDGGANWQQNVTPTISRLHGIFTNTSGFGTAVGDTGKILRTTSGGAAWLSQNSGTSASLYDVVMFNNDASVGMVCGSNGTILKTTNSGGTWTALNSGVTVTLRALSFINMNVCYVVGDSGKVLKTINGGTNWTQQNSTLTQNLRGVSFIDTATGTAVGDNGKVIRTTNGGITFIQPVSNEIPKEFSLSQNYPNPFNPVTSFKLQISAPANVKIIVYDVLGKETAVLVSEELKPGTYEVQWDASAFPSGIYYYKLTTADYSGTKKMVLLK